MFYNYHEDYQYDSCIAKGICSINPRTFSLSEVLVMYLKQLAFYTLKLKRLGLKNNATEGIILNTLSGLMSNLEFGNEQFYKTLLNLKTIIVESIKEYTKICEIKKIKPQFAPTELKLNKQQNISELIRLGEKEFSDKFKEVSEDKKNLYEIIFSILKSICINLVELQSFGENDERAYSEILYLLNTLNYPASSINIFRKKISIALDIDYCLQKKLYTTKEKHFGHQTEGEVPYTTYPNKAILVAGTNLQELKNVLDFTKDKEIDIYTHGEMINVYTYPLFREYKHLKGQFGIGIENCLLDFANFPGSIFIAKHSLETIEYLYRGRLFTTDNFVPQGVLRIVDNDFSQLVDSALSARGFKKGQKHPSIKFGCSDEYLSKKLEELILNLDKYKKIIILPTEINTRVLEKYFESFLAQIKNDTFVISLTKINYKRDSIIINSAPNFYMVYKILEKILEPTKEKGIDISVFISKCDKHTISNVLNLKKLGISNIFLSKCTPIMLNPTLTETLRKEYGIHSTTTAIEDLKSI